MRKLSFIIALCLIHSVAMAQDRPEGNPPPRKNSSQMITEMDKGIAKAISNLSEQQKQRIHQLNVSFVKEMENHRPRMRQGQEAPRPPQPPKEMKGKKEMKVTRPPMSEKHGKYDADMKKILSPGQYILYQNYEKKHCPMGKPGDLGEPGMPPDDSDGPPRIKM